MLQTKPLYDHDFNLWVAAQQAALKEHRYIDLDLPNLIEELDGLTKRDKRALKSQLRVLLTHLLKWQYQPQKRSSSWQASIDNARVETVDILDDSPSLRNYLPEILSQCYQFARKQAAKETHLAMDTDCPYALEQALQDGEE
ncbi:DUF29 domain-containing protein [Leptolyngbya iicbica]|uniref:DUF29 domain-containing protein n=2 Tax=Cyanophyceae TaxID=3028117 RepID=A0A4V2E200_9CYAN|nr:DUF29 domain-containing protein [Leptolyngbya sp. LK]RZM76121.1 DUF29 domain-containing protein [Leptolyngbya sp. LK]